MVILSSPKHLVSSNYVLIYGNPLQGGFIYLNHHPRPGILINTLGLEDKGGIGKVAYALLEGWFS
jgi:hypothetical protein